MELLPRPRREVAPGAVHVPDWLDPEAQRELVEACRGWRGYRATRLPGGGVMSVRTVCLGWHWSPYRYTRTVDDGSPVLPFPDWLADLGQRALADAYGAAVDYRPDVALVNFYDAAAKMGQHQDKDERALDPVVSLSLGDTCVPLRQHGEPQPSLHRHRTALRRSVRFRRSFAAGVPRRAEDAAWHGRAGAGADGAAQPDFAGFWVVSSSSGRTTRRMAMSRASGLSELWYFHSSAR